MMAYKLMFPRKPSGLTHIWTISNSVGTQTSEANTPTDVRLVKLLMHIIATGPVGDFPKIHAGCAGLPKVNDEMDIQLGFRIYYLQVEYKFIADGFLSPTIKENYSRRLIGILNYNAFRRNQKEWENLPNHPLCSAALKHELLTKIV
jgi:hypothetical protein